MELRKVRTVCARDCYDTCFMVAEVRGGRLISIRGDNENPLTGDFLCPRGMKDPERLYRNRVLYPHLRVGEKPGRGFRRASWHEALDLVAERLRETLESHSSEAILHLDYAGNMGLLTWNLPQRLWNAISAAKTDYSICSRSGHEALSLHYGSSYGRLPEEIADMRLLVFWGFNAAVSSPHIWSLARRSGEGGAFIVAVDPRRSETAEGADLWINPKPGTDVALAYGVARFLIEGGYVNLEFIEEWTEGYEQYVSRVMEWSPGRVEKTTGVEWRVVEELGEAYGELGPSLTLMGFGFQKSVQGAEAVRAVSLIPALLGLHRGFYYSNGRGWLIDLSYLSGEGEMEEEIRVVSHVALARHIEEGEFKFIYIYNTNPVLTLPHQGGLRRGLCRGEVFVVLHDPHWTETAEYADVVLPAPSFLEKDDLVVSYSHNLVRVSRRVVEPLGESRDEIWVMRELAGRLGIGEDWIYEDPWEALGRALEGALEGGSLSDLLRGETLRLKMKPREEYQTPTGRIEFYSKMAERLGLNPLPKQLLLEAAEGSFMLLNSASPRYTHTQFREVYGDIPAVVMMSVEDAMRLGVESGEEVILYNELGEVEVEAIVTEGVPRGVLWSPRQLVGLNGEPQNALVHPWTQRIGGGPTFNSTVVRVRPSDLSRLPRHQA